MEVAGDLKGRRSGRRGVAGYAVHGRDRLLDGLATQPAAVMDARDLQALDSVPGNAAHGLHRKLLVVGPAVEAGGGNGVESLLSRRIIARREGHSPLLHVATGCGPRHVLHGGVNCIDAPLAAEVDARHLHLDLGLLTHELLLHFQMWLIARLNSLEAFLGVYGLIVAPTITPDDSHSDYASTRHGCQRSCRTSSCPSRTAASHRVRSPSRQTRRSSRALPTASPRRVTSGSHFGSCGSTNRCWVGASARMPRIA